MNGTHLNFKLIGFLACCILAICALSACHESGLEKPKIFEIGMVGDVSTFDPALVSDPNGFALAYDLFEGLASMDPQSLETIPAIAKRWEISPDKRQYTFFLREDAKFSSGRTIFAKDFSDSWFRALLPETRAPYAFLLYCIQNAEDYAKGKIVSRDLVGIVVEGPHVLTVRLDKPIDYFLKLVAFPVFFPIPMERLRKYRNKWTNWDHIVSTGPFQITTPYDPLTITLSRNHYYWDRKKIKIDGVKYHTRLSGQEIHEMYFSQKIQKTIEIPQSHIEQEKDLPDFHLSPTFSTMLLRFNLTHPVLQKLEVRQALATSMDSQKLVADFCRSHQIPAHSLVPPMFHFYNSPPAPTFDLAKTQTEEKVSLKNKQLLSGLTLMYDAKGEKKQVALWITHQWKKHLGIDVQVQEFSVSEFIARESNLNYDLSLSEWYGDYLYPTTFLNLFRSDSGTNRTGWRNSHYDELIDQAGLRTDRRIKIALLQEAEALLLQELPIFPLFHGAKDYLLSPNVTGVFDNSLFFQPNKYVDFR